ncbi:MAG: FAD:protein FMN transferase [Gammaproteobacteria bacterium]
MGSDRFRFDDFAPPRRLFKGCCFMVLALCLLWQTGCSEPALQKVQGFAQGTSYHISYWAEAPINIKKINTDIANEFENIDRVLSNYRPDSIIEAFNKTENTEVQEVGAEIVSLVSVAQSVHSSSRGCYDLTIKPLFDLWGFNTDKPVIPEKSAVDENMRKVGIDKLQRVDATHLRKKIPELKIDVSSIAQGYSVERISRVLEQNGISHYLVEIGGELKTRGHKPGRHPWRIAVEKPLPGEQMLQKIFSMPMDSPLAIMTSGTYRHYFDEKGIRYGHILDARTGRPVTHDLVSVTVAHENPALADAWSTALLCLGQQEGLKAANDNLIPALFIQLQGEKLIESRSAPLDALTILTIH